MQQLLIALSIAPIVIALYAYVGYPVVLELFAASRKEPLVPDPPFDWPTVTVTVPVYNAVGSIRRTLESLLAIDYPRDRLQLLVISDGSTDGTDNIVRSYAKQNIELLRLGERRGKTWAENVAVGSARGEIIVNIDATVFVTPSSLKPLIRAFSDPTVGVASGRDVSVGSAGAERIGGESGYVGYEMWVRALETRAGSIVGASGCFYAIRRRVHATALPPELSWDFASVLIARELGFRSVSVPAAICLVPRTIELSTELRRKVRTMARGLSTLLYKRALLNPFRYGSFAVMLISHKLLRWLPYLLAPTALLAVAVLADTQPVARVCLAMVAVGALIGVIGMRVAPGGRMLHPLRLAGFVVAAFAGGLVAWILAIRGTRLTMWDPTPRPESHA